MRFSVFITFLISISVLFGGFLFWWDSNDNNSSKTEERPSYTVSFSPNGQVFSSKSNEESDVFVQEDIIPPTNTWFSSAAFQKQSQPLFASPLSVDITKEGFTLAKPQVTRKTNVISAPHEKMIEVTFQNTSDITATVKEYDDLAVTLILSNEKQELGELKIVRGIPYISFTLKSDVNSTLTSYNGGLVSENDSQRVISRQKPQFFMTGMEGTSLKRRTGIDNVISLSTTDRAKQFSLGFLPSNVLNEDQFQDLFSTSIRSTQVSFTETEEKYNTQFHIETNDGVNTAFTLLPYQAKNLTKNNSLLGEYDTSKGEVVLYEGQEFTISTPKYDIPSTPFNERNFSQQEKEKLNTLLKKDAEQISFQADTYFGGKTLAKTANLLQLADQIGNTEVRNTLQEKLRTELENWFRKEEQSDAQYFAYEPQFKGVIGYPPSFETDKFNDHHFHYGYFVYAASVLAQYDEEFLNQYEEEVDALIADYGSPLRNENQFPHLRVFDLYVGHSWASGYAPFEAGNNQESSSEAINAWYAAALWGQITDKEYLTAKMKWVLSREIEATKNMWLTPPDVSSDNGYQNPLVSLVWGGKMSYETWFSAEDSAKLGIQLIPMNFIQKEYLNTLSKDQIQSHLRVIDEEYETLSPSIPLSEYIIMYRALINPDKALNEVKKYTVEDLDKGMSLSFMYAWIYQELE